MDIRQFAYAGIDVYGILAKTTGKTTDELKKMDISFEDLSNALIEASKEGGKYYKGQQKSAKTLNGQINTLTKDFKELLGQLTESLLPTIKKIISRVSEVIQKFKSLDQGTKDRIVKIGLIVTALTPLLTLTGKLITSIGTIITTLSKLTSIISKVTVTAGGLTTAFSLGAIGVTALTGLTIALSEKSKILSDDLKKVTDKVNSQTDSWNKVKESAQNYINLNSDEISGLQKLKDELNRIVDENGKVKTGYEERASFIVSELSEALGIEINLNNGIIENYKEIESSLDGVIRKKKVELLLDAHAEEYTTALENQKDATKLLNELESDRTKLLEDISKAQKKTNNTKEVMQLQGQLTILNNKLADQKDLVGQYSYSIQNYEELQNKSISGSAEEIDKAIQNITTSWENSTKDVGYNIYQQEQTLSDFVTFVGDTNEDIADEISGDTKVIRAVQGVTNDVNSALVENINGKEWGQDLVENMATGIESKMARITNAVSNVANRIKDYLGFSVPDKGALADFDKSMPDMIDLMVKGLRTSFPKLELEAEKIAKQMNTTLNIADADITQKIIHSEPNVVSVNFYPKQMTEAEMERAFNYVDRRYGMAY